MTYLTFLYILAILAQVGLIIYFVRRGRAQRNKSLPMPDRADSDTYESQRAVALSVSAAQLKLYVPDTTTFVFGVVMDCNTGDAIVTLAAYITGATSMFFSTGGGRTAGGKNPFAAEAAAQLVDAAQAYIGRAISVTVIGLPLKGCVRFYLLTNLGIYAAQEHLVFLEDGTSPWLHLFELANDVIHKMHNGNNGIAAH
jgi:hypothetical protein